jgi:hypothetical protein
MLFKSIKPFITMWKLPKTIVPISIVIFGFVDLVRANPDIQPGRSPVFTERQNNSYEKLRQSKTFNNPFTFDNLVRLDVCLNFGRDCGQPVADIFCKKWFYMGAKDYQLVSNLGKTKLITDVYDIKRNEFCKGPNCGGFKYITCQGQLDANEKFANPVWQGRQLDYCMTWAKDCGQPVADAFCREQGFSKSLYWKKSTYYAQQPTLLIGTGELCDPAKGNSCNYFGVITCQPR